MTISVINLLKCTAKKEDADETSTDDDHPPLWFRQSVAALGPLLLSVVVGMTLGYSAVLLPQLQESVNNLDVIKINTEEASWIASLAVIPMAFGTLIGGVLMEKYGRKNTHIITCSPYFAGWLLMYFAVNLEMLLIGRFVTGLSSGMIAPATGVYIGEITEPKLRGVLLGGIPLSVSLGLLVSHLLGTFLSWQTTALIIALLPLISWILMIFPPESPTWLAQRGRTEQARRAFYWLRGSSDASKSEIEQMLARQKEINGSDGSSFIDHLKELLVPEFWKPMVILLVLFITSQWAGVNAVNFYSVTFMKEIFGDTVNEYLATFIIDCTRVIASIVSCILLRKIGRRQLGIIGGVGTYLPLMTLSVFTYITKLYNIENSISLAAIPITCLLVYIFFVTAGFVSLPWNLLGELLPMAKKSIGSGIASFVAYMSVFSVVKTMPALFEHYGVDGAFTVYATMTLFGTAFAACFLPETKGKTLHEIEKYFRNEETDSDNGKTLDIRL
ncbi:facilitated trehalose transporter Tret1-2 homolog [Dendroctonus ponderosae]|nr:facilitated trehalose transporter Tret1-2 homolog [Dendroctonus ponderosae]KAH1018638.1 hypothetical protein HUJ05_006367 [Dendroctonus ponderosae]